MARTTPELVKGIIEIDDTLVTDLTPFIDSANELVTEVCASIVTIPGTNVVAYTDTRLELIERWLAAHFAAIMDKRTSSELIGGQGGSVGEKYQYKVGLSLASTMYGQQAMLIDTSGKLAALSKRAEEGRQRLQLGVTYLGTKPRCD